MQEVLESGPRAFERPVADTNRRARRGNRGRLLTILGGLTIISFYCALVFAWLWPADFRAEWAGYAALSLLAFYIDTFAFQGGVALLVLGLLLAAGRRWRLGIATLPAVALTVGPALLSSVPRTPPAVIGDTLKVMSVNLLAFNRETAGIAAEIAAADPDLLFIQEYNERWDHAIRAAVGDRYPHVYTVPRPDCFGMALYSKLPFEGPVDPNLRLGEVAHPAMRAVVRFRDRRVALYNVHLVPPAGVPAFRRQGQQVADLIERIAAERDPLIVAGDFNFTSESCFGRAMARTGLIDAHEAGGRGRGSTWSMNSFVRHLSGVRIDHIFLGNGLTCTSSHVGMGEGSDHRPVLASVGFP